MNRENHIRRVCGPGATRRCLLITPELFRITHVAGHTVLKHVRFGGTVVLINAIVGFLQEAKAEKAIEALARMIATEATVRRDGRQWHSLRWNLKSGIASAGEPEHG